MYNEIAVELPGLIDELSRKEAQQLLHVIIDGLLFKEGRGQGDLNDDLQQKLLAKQLDALGACAKASEHATSSNAFIQQAATGVLNGMLANPNEEMSGMSNDKLVETSVDLAEKLYEKLHEKHHI